MSSSLYCHATDEITFRQTYLGVTDNNVPPKVTGLYADTNNYYPLLLSWNETPDDTNIIRYQIKCNGQLTGHSHKNQYKDYSIHPGQTYVYTVNAVDKGGNQGDYSSTMMIVVPPGLANIIINGEFDDGLTQWRPEVFATGNNMVAGIDATGQLSGQNSAKLYITQSTTTDWHMQFRQLFNAYAARNYEVKFQARSSPATNIKVWIQKYADPYTIYMNRGLSLTTSPQTFTFNSNNFPVNDYVALTFVVGNQPTVPVTIWIDAVVLTDGTTAPSDPQNCTEVQSGYYAFYADLSGDCYVGYADLGKLTEQWLSMDCGSNNDCNGADFEPDGDVDMIDLSNFAFEWLNCNNPQDQACEPTW
jgi:hypothetical protein